MSALPKPESPPEFAPADFPPFFRLASSAGLIWLPDPGLGFCRVVAPAIYGSAYWVEYTQRDASEIGRRLTAGRREFVGSVLGSWPRVDLVDVGIGGGRFCREADCLGFDVNPLAIEWLQHNDRWFDLGRASIQNACFFDSLEHIVDPTPMLANIREHAFVSTPIYKDMQDCLRSKHLKLNGEHVHYWTRKGLDVFMRWHGFEMVARSEFETWCGREGIESFAFKRVEG